MATANPYTPPRAAVADVRGEPESFSEPKVWSASGRIGRLRYLAYLMVGYLVLGVAVGVVSALGAVMHAPILIGLMTGVGAIAYLVMSIFSAIQRSHDMDWSGWSILLGLIPFVGLIWFFKAGTPGENRFGAPPPPNTTGVKVGASLMLFVFVLGIVAAISLPAYQNYIARAKAKQMQMQPQQPQQQQ